MPHLWRSLRPQPPLELASSPLINVLLSAQYSIHPFSHPGDYGHIYTCSPLLPRLYSGRLQSRSDLLYSTSPSNIQKTTDHVRHALHRLDLYTPRDYKYPSRIFNSPQLPHPRSLHSYSKPFYTKSASPLQEPTTPSIPSPLLSTTTLASPSTQPCPPQPLLPPNLASACEQESGV